MCARTLRCTSLPLFRVGSLGALSRAIAAWSTSFSARKASTFSLCASALRSLACDPPGHSSLPFSVAPSTHGATSSTTRTRKAISRGSTALGTQRAGNACRRKSASVVRSVDVATESSTSRRCNNGTAMVRTTVAPAVGVRRVRRGGQACTAAQVASAARLIALAEKRGKAPTPLAL
jgi:hypothetical protein